MIPPSTQPRSRGRPVLHPNHYAWYVLFSAIDVMTTTKILDEFFDHGGREVNPIADFFIRSFGLWGAIGLKFSTVVLVVVVCEIVGRRAPLTGRALAWSAVGLSIFPVAVALFMLARFALTPHAG